MILIGKNTPQKVNRKRMGDRENEVWLATKSAQGPLLQRDTYGCRADMDYDSLVLCVKAFTLTSSNESTSMHIHKIKMLNVSFFISSFSCLRIYPERIMLCNVYISYIYIFEIKNVTTGNSSNWTRK